MYKVVCFKSHLIAALQSLTISAGEVLLHISMCAADAILLRPLAFSYLFFPLPSSIQNHSSESTLRPVQKADQIRWNLLSAMELLSDRALLFIFPLCSNSLIGSVGFRQPWQPVKGELKGLSFDKMRELLSLTLRNDTLSEF